ncbi:MAG: energy transducer TonB family protein, partial [bacterium]
SRADIPVCHPLLIFPLAPALFSSKIGADQGQAMRLAPALFALFLVPAAAGIPATGPPEDSMERCWAVAVRQTAPDLKDFRLKEGERYKRSPVVSFLIKDTGEVAEVKLKRSSGVRGIDRMVLDAVRKWKFNARPGCPDIEITTSVTIHFR